VAGEGALFAGASLQRMFRLPAALDAAQEDCDLVDLYANELVAEALVDPAVAYGIALDSFVSDPEAFRSNVRAIGRTVKVDEQVSMSISVSQTPGKSAVKSSQASGITPAKTPVVKSAIKSAMKSVPASRTPAKTPIVKSAIKSAMKSAPASPAAPASAVKMDTTLMDTTLDGDDDDKEKEEEDGFGILGYSMHSNGGGYNDLKCK
jgi:hypothetical protein